MEREFSDTYLLGNTDYLSRFVHVDDDSQNYIEDTKTLRHTVLERIERTLDVQSAEIVVRGLAGETLEEISDQMRLNFNHVEDILFLAPSIVMHPSHNRLQQAITISEKLPSLSTAHAIAKATGMHQNWTRDRLRDSELETTEGITPIGDRPTKYYNSQVAIGLIKELIANRPERAGDWMTIGEMARRLKKEYEWVATRVHEKNEDQGEMRLDTRHRPSMHYPPRVFELLQAEVNSLENYPIAGETDYTLYALSTLIDRDEKWLHVRLDTLSIRATTKLNPVNNRPDHYYSELVKDFLAQEDERLKKYPVATENDASMEKLRKALGHDLRWVARRLPYISIHPVVKMNPANNQLGEFYPFEETKQALLDLPDDILKYPGPKLAHENVQKLQNTVNRSGFDEFVTAWKKEHHIEAIPKKLDHRQVARHFVPVGLPIKLEPYVAPHVQPTKVDWRDFAECAQVAPELFFPEKGASPKDSKKICGQCAVTSFCLEYALDTKQADGVWAGYTAGELKAIRRERRR
jgi:WhiB family redox-sensing transcriptional regulator